MISLAQWSLLASFAAAGYSAFACLAGARDERGRLSRVGHWAGVFSVLALTLVLALLIWALCFHDFRFLYVKQYSSQSLPWFYSVSALWVGQAGSLLLWAWMLGILSVWFARRGGRTGAPGVPEAKRPDRETGRVETRAFGLLMGYLCFLTGTMVFAADPMTSSVDRAGDGAGLSPLLQHPAMMIHPPVVFLAYAGWAVPCALTLAALVEGSTDNSLLKRLRSWALFSWALLGSGILLGAQWSYEELGWGGYWAWDPVENASLIPWLTGTAFIHSLMAWRSRGIFKKTAAALAVATFGLCNLASFLTRSGIFSSLHAFSRSPIGWLFLGLMLGLAVAGLGLILVRRRQLAPERAMTSLLSCEAMVLVSTAALVLLSALVTVGTVFVALSEWLVGRRIVVGPDFYNVALISTGLILLATIAPSPLLQWGGPSSRARKTALASSGAAALIGCCAGLAWDLRHPLTLVLAGLVPATVTALAGRLVLDMERRRPSPWGVRLGATLLDSRRTYSGFLAHLGFVGLGVGVTVSSLGSVRSEFELSRGQSVNWAGRSIHFDALDRFQRPDKLVVTATLRVTGAGGRVATLHPSQHHHTLQGLWTTETAIDRRLGGDFHAVLHRGDYQKVQFMFISAPLMSCVWGGGWLIGLAVVVGLLPERVLARSGRTGMATRAPRREVLSRPSRFTARTEAGVGREIQ